MTTLIKYILTLLSLLWISTIHAQSVSAKVVDQNTGDPIPFATVMYEENKGVITNEEGIFNIILYKTPTAQDSIHISSMGYEEKAIALTDSIDNTIALVVKEFELKGVFLTSNPLSPEEIIEKVEENLSKNYYSQNLSRKKIFFRQSDLNKMNKVDFGFKKSTIEELDKQLIDSIAQLVPRSSEYYREVVGDFYGNYSNHKLYVDKAAELYDKSKDVSMDGLGKKMERIFKENIKPDSYLKIKSGIFGTKVQLDSITEANEDADRVKVEVEKNGESHTDNHHGFNEQIVSRISELYEQLFFNEDSKLDIIEKANRYEFTQEDYTYIDNEPVYILHFEPKGKKDFKGTMYVNTNDFAVVRLEFDNVRPLFKFGLLGITYRENVYRGKMLFQKDASGVYNPRYISLEQGSYFGVDRPLKIKEKNKNVKGRRLQNELSLALDVRGTELQKYELVVFNSEVISDTAYDIAPENKEVKASYLSKYDPSFWEGFTIMEPNEAIQSFEVVE